MVVPADLAIRVYGCKSRWKRAGSNADIAIAGMFIGTRLTHKPFLMLERL